MNKKFSTLLATALVAGGLGSSAFATDYPVGQYVQLNAGGKLLVVGESSVRDSLAFAKELSEDAKYDLYEFNQTLWKFVVETKKGNNGLPNGYNVYLENKVNGAVALTKADASADKSLYYAPGAVVSTGRLLVASGNVYNAETKKVTFDGNISFTGDVVYDAASKTLKYYYLQQNASETTLKLMLKTKKLQKDDLKTEATLAAAKKTFKNECNQLEGVVSISVAEASTDNLDVTAKGLNKVGNNAFDLTFNKDISANAKFGNPFTASSLRASTYKSFKAAGYETEAYDAQLKKAKETIADLKQLKTDASSFVKEMKVGVNYTEYNGQEANVLAAAPNAADIQEVIDNNINPNLKLLADGGEATEAFEALLGLANGEDAIKYSKEVTGKNEAGVTVTYLVVEKAKEATEDLDKALKTVNEKLGKVIEANEKAIAAYDEAVRNSMTSYQIETTNWVDFADFADFDKKAANTLLMEASALLADGNEIGKLEASDITVTVSEENTTGYYPLEVVGKADTYVTVDTIYVASREKYLSLNTVKLDKVAVDVDGKPLADDVKFDEDLHDYVIVPSKGHNLTPALFKLDVAPLAVGADKITIFANAPKAISAETAKYFDLYKDNTSYYDSSLKVVIRTLAGTREVSVMLSNEDPAVEKNTTITFSEPALATKINDGDIYHVIALNEAKETQYGKYFVATATPEEDLDYAKEAYLNVPATQWLVKKNNDKYTFENRDFDVQCVLNEKVFIVDEEKGIYTNAKRDTFQVVKLDVAKEGHLGYKYIAEDIQQISEYALSAVNYANMETPYYLSFDGNKDSVLTATADKEKALALVPMLDKDNKEVTSAYAMNDKNLSKQYYQLISKVEKDTLYLDYKDGELIVTKVPNENLLQFRNINDVANAYEVLIGTKDADNEVYEPSKKISYNQTGKAVAVELEEATAFVYDLVDNSTDIYKNFGFNGTTNVIISLNGDAASKVTKVGPFATVKRTGLELRAAAKDEDFVLVMDTAYVDHKDNIRYAYYITKPIEDATKTAWNDEKFYMVTYTDSLDRSNDTIKYSQDKLTRIGFVPAKRVDADKLAILKENATAADTLDVTEAQGVTNATFAFAIDEDNEEAYRIESNKGEYVSYLNGILVLGNKQQAQLFNVNATELNPTHNDEVAVEGVQVIAGNGTVTVQGAAGQEVTIATVLGKVVANEVVTSDNATIAAPAGVVFVTVNGETTKVVVK